MDIKDKVPWQSEDAMINLIKSDLIHSRLLEGLRLMSLEPDDYCLKLDEVILWHFGIREPKLVEQHKDSYCKLALKASQLKLTYNNKEFEDLAREIFIELKATEGFSFPNHEALSLKSVS